MLITLIFQFFFDHHFLINPSTLYSVASVLDCARLCRFPCSSFFYNPAQHQCALANQVYEETHPDIESAPGWIYYSSGTVGTEECTGSCPSISHAHCHEGRCRCDIGYATDGMSCRNLTECPKFADTFTVYTGYATGNNALPISNGYVTSLQQCQDYCLSAAGCVGADLYPDGNNCAPDATTWYGTSPENRWTSDDDWKYSQRDCDWSG